MDYLEAFRKVLMAAPKHHLTMAKCENCDYNVFLYASKNCYMCHGSSWLEDCYYCYVCKTDRDCGDCAYTLNSELCHECVDCLKCYQCEFCQDCQNSRGLRFCYDCNGCSDCFGCVGLRKKQFHIFNQPYFSKASYEAKLKEIFSRGFLEGRRFTEQELEKLKIEHPRISIHGVNNEGCTGDYVTDSKNCLACYGIEKSQDSMYCLEEIFNIRDSMDITNSHNSELCYQCGTLDNVYNCNFAFWCTNSRDCEFLYCVHGCENCFMCTYLQKKKFYILNEPYSEKEYFAKVAEIKNWLKERGLYGQHLVYLALADTPEIQENLKAL